MKVLIYRYSLRMTNDPWEAEDLSQDALLKVHRALELNPQLSISKAYLFRVVSNAWKDKWKRRKGRQALFGDAVLDVAVQDGELSTRELLEVLAERLSPRSLVILLLRDVFDFTARETAAFLSSTEEAIQVALGRARLRLRKLADRSKAEEGLGEARRQSAQWGPHDFDKLVDAFRRRDPRSICRAYIGLARQRVRISRLLWSNGKLAFYLEDPDGNRFMITE
ncbi:RNA polymerase sigma factor [Paenibacillus rhizovicinus]|uniref:RNA polymerase sigma factor n=1 Tax=Paenibacillus rhizovicinus TaxID=2704463 RepID=A0A6C0P0A2_9BACL|nr:RNA polymerase sigma factor [Paenibacillus rhizovicinus]QHW31343.1 RNA polymerase sigma factor [Paenibacillus rhizovicinus]